MKMHWSVDDSPMQSTAQLLIRCMMVMDCLLSFFVFTVLDGPGCT